MIEDLLEQEQILSNLKSLLETGTVARLACATINDRMSGF